MTPDILQLFGQLGFSGLLFYLLLEERKARNAEVQHARDEKIIADKRYFDFLEKLILRSLHIVPEDIRPGENP
jgi:hypothetical protein